jgi:hypothetical protein
MMIGMQPEVLSGLIGFGGAVVGGGAAIFGTWLTLNHQRKQAREERLLNLGQAATDAAISELIQLLDFLRTVGKEHSLATQLAEYELPWTDTANQHLKAVDLAIRRIPDRAVYERVRIPLRLAINWRAAGTMHLHAVVLLIRMADDMLEVLSAYLRRDSLPSPSEDVKKAQRKLEAYVPDHEAERRRLMRLAEADVARQNGDDAPS